jgi:hypothetical protein
LKYQQSQIPGLASQNPGDLRAAYGGFLSLSAERAYLQHFERT